MSEPPTPHKVIAATAATAPIAPNIRWPSKEASTSLMKTSTDQLTRIALKFDSFDGCDIFDQF